MKLGFTPDDENYVKNVPGPPGSEALYAPLKKHLHARYRLRWRRKVALLLVTGDEAAIEQLVPGLRQQRGWKATAPC
jgi:type VI secretion system protein ImpL